MSLVRFILNWSIERIARHFEALYSSEEEHSCKVGDSEAVQNYPTRRTTEKTYRH